MANLFARIERLFPALVAITDQFPGALEALVDLVAYQTHRWQFVSEDVLDVLGDNTHLVIVHGDKNVLKAWMLPTGYSREDAEDDGWFEFRDGEFVESTRPEIVG